MIIHRKKVSLLCIIIAIALAGCSSGKNDSTNVHTADMSMEPIKVELAWSPAEVSVNQKVTFEATVTQGSELVDDAKEVLFEIVDKNDKTQKTELKGVSAGNGKYTAEGKLSEEGQYHVTSHVTARTQHSMPTKELSVQP